MKQSGLNIRYIIICLLLPGMLTGQYMMQNALVTDCEGTLTDSENGPMSGQYDHEEDYTFTICVEGASEITVVFDFFATEANFDIMTVYDGPDINAPLITTLDGVLTNPPVIVATSGCISFHFVSDDNIVADGWSLSWSVEVDDIADPDMLVASELECPSGGMEININPSVPCEVLSPEFFQIIGPSSTNITEVIPIDCDSEDRSSSFILNFGDSLDLAGNYLIVFAAYIVNSCGDTLEFESNLNFELRNCPFQVEIYEIEAACAGDCGQVGVEIYDDDPGPHLISWSHTLDVGQSVDACADSFFTVSVLVENLSNGLTAEDQFVYTSIPLPQILNPLMSDTFCSARGNHNFTVDIADGRWNSIIMDNTEDERYNFRRWSNSDGIQQDIISYTDPNGCIAMDTVYIIPVNAGRDQAACIGEDELILIGNNPDDGIWSGPFTSPDGIFTVSAPGEYTIFYTNMEGCIDQKKVDIVDAIEFTPIDTLCSNRDINLRDNVNAFGGTWTGPGITHARNGRLKAWQANINAWNTYYYQIQGCLDSMEIYIQGIWAGPDRSVCTLTETIQLPFDGIWTGPGVYNPIDSTYDISNVAPGTYDITGRVGSCQDKMELTIHEVELEYIGDEKYCYDAGLIPIEDIVNISPDQGSFSGEAVVDLADEMYLDPSMIQGTESFVVFEALGCVDSVMVQIELPVILDDYEFCEFDDLQTLDNNGNTGYWEGPGILIPESGLINIEDLNIGFNEVYFVTDLGCRTPVTANVVGFVEAEINNVLESYCFQDSSHIMDLVPANGIFTVNGIQSTNTINPAELGSGFHELKYIVGTGECEDRTSTFIVVSDPISGFTYAVNDTLCPEESTTIFVESSGGFDVINGFWDQNLGFGKSHIVFPDATTQYAVTLTDGCSEELTLDLEVVVIDSFDVDFSFGPEVCFGDSSFIEILLDEPEDFVLEWNGNPGNDDIVYSNFPGDYQLSISAKATGCEQDYWLTVPGAEPINAGFSIIPNQDTIDLINNEIRIINLAQGYSSGGINFGNGDPEIDLDSGDLLGAYNEIGDFTISQWVTNELGCRDSVSRQIYVENVLLLYVPNIFNPADKDNNAFTVSTLGSNNVEVYVYNRWGNLVFQSTDLDTSWDGTYQGNPAKAGVYSVLVIYEDQKTGLIYKEAYSVTLVR